MTEWERDAAYHLDQGAMAGLFVRKARIAFKLDMYDRPSPEKKKAVEKSLASQAVTRL